MDEKSISYFLERERIEREAATAATCDTARIAHNQLADGYAALVRNGRINRRQTLSGLWSLETPAVEANGRAMKRHSGGPF